MATAPWKQSLIGSFIAAVIAATAVAMALTADISAAGDRTPSQQARGASQKVWAAAKPLLDMPVRLGTLQESATVNGNWIDLYVVNTVIDGTSGHLKIARDFGPSAELDALALLTKPQPEIVGFAIGFKPDGEAEEWSWARYDANGNVQHNSAGYPIAARFTADDAAQCVAGIWMEMVTTG